MAVYSNTIYLNANGWSLDSNPTTSNLLGIWSNKSDEIIIDTRDLYGIRVLSGITVHTLAGNDFISSKGYFNGIENRGTINTDEGNDSITGISFADSSGGFFNTSSTVNTGEGNDSITGISLAAGAVGLFNQKSSVITDNGNDTITGTATVVGLSNQESSIYAGKGNDTITGTATGNSIGFIGIVNQTGSTIDTGTGNDVITGTGYYQGILNGNSNEFVDTINTGDGNDIITGISTGGGRAGITNFGPISTGDGNDIITGNNTSGYGIENNNVIDTGEGKDTVITNGGFSGDGSVFLGNGNDKLSGFGTGKFYGGCGKDTLILPSDHYTVGAATIGGETFMTLTRGGITMNTREFESLIVGSNTYNFASLAPGSIVG